MGTEQQLRAQEEQLLRQLIRTPVHSAHSATIEVARRLVDKGEAMMWPAHAQAGFFIEITATGKQSIQ